MTIVELLTVLRSNEVQLWVKGETLRYSAPSGRSNPSPAHSAGPAQGGSPHGAAPGQRGHGRRPPPLQPVSQAGDLPLSFAQQRLWFLSELQAEAGAVVQHQRGLRLEGALDQAALRTALRQLTARQQSLRMNSATCGGQPRRRAARALRSAGGGGLCGLSQGRSRRRRSVAWPRSTRAGRLTWRTTRCCG